MIEETKLNERYGNEMHELPHLAIITDTSFDNRATGIARTLINLFSKYPKDRLRVISTSTSRNSTHSDYACQMRYECIGGLPRLHNRLGLYINPVFSFFDRSWINFKTETIFQEVDQQILLVLCASTLDTYIAGYRFAKAHNLPYIVYLMDDLRDSESHWWFNGNGKTFFQSMLKDALGWMTIGPELQEVYESRFNLSPLRVLNVHNPVDIRNRSWKSLPADKSIEIAYAGSIWGMHRDALLKMASVISCASAAGIKIKLKIYTSEYFWLADVNEWEKYGVEYGGEIGYENLFETLERSHACLVVSSFLDTYAHVSKTSIQTKITDYMAAGRAIIAYGPDYAACNHFVERWKCGWVLTETDPHRCSKNLIQSISDKNKLTQFGIDGFQVAQDHFATDRIQGKLHEFISKCWNDISGKE